MGVTMTVTDDTGHIDFDGDLAEAIVGLIDAAIPLAGEVGASFDSEGANDGGGDAAAAGEIAVLRAIGAEIASTMARQEIADVAFLGRHQLVDVRSAIETARREGATWTLLAQCETGLRRVRKALVAIESAICEYHGIEPIPRAWESIADALEIRRVYGQFRRSITRPASAAEPSVRSDLQRAARRIAILRDRTIYPYLRIQDRREIRRFQKRIKRWLAADQTAPEHAREGERLWQDLVGFAGLLGEVNRREILCRHDRDVIAEALREVARQRPSKDGVPPRVLDQMQNLVGRDDELDELLLDPRAAEDARPWQRPLHRLLDELDQPYRMG